MITLKLNISEDYLSIFLKNENNKKIKKTYYEEM